MLTKTKIIQYAIHLSTINFMVVSFALTEGKQEYRRGVSTVLISFPTTF